MKKCKWLSIILVILVIMLSGCNKDKGKEKDGEGVDLPTTTTETIINPEITPMTFNCQTKAGAMYVYELMYTDYESVTLSSDDIVLPDGLTADITVAPDTTDTDLWTVLLSNIKAEKGVYSIGIKEGTAVNGQGVAPAYSFKVLVGSADVSEYVLLECASSDTEVNSGETLSIMAKYTGISNNKYMTLNMSEEFIRLNNCTGSLEFSTANHGLSSCVILSNVQAVDMAQPCSVEILEGSAVDADGAPVGGAIIEFTVK